MSALMPCVMLVLLGQFRLMLCKFMLKASSFCLVHIKLTTTIPSRGKGPYKAPASQGSALGKALSGVTPSFTSPQSEALYPIQTPFEPEKPAPVA